MSKYWIFENGRKIKITRENMLNMVCQHWNDIIENKLTEKWYSSCISEFVNHNENEPEFDMIRNNCFACDYFTVKAESVVFYEKYCKKCPFYKYQHKENIDDFGFCENVNSPYFKFLHVSEYPEKSKEFALEICQLFIDEE